VEVLALGDDLALAKLREFLRSGPDGAKVSGVEDQAADPGVAALDPFGILK
jgi:acylphosphatase